MASKGKAPKLGGGRGMGDGGEFWVEWLVKHTFAYVRSRMQASGVTEYMETWVEATVLIQRANEPARTCTKWANSNQK